MNNDTEQLLQSSPPITIEELTVHRIEHDIEVAAGTLRIVEYVTPEALTRTPRRALWLLPGPIATGDFFSIPHPGYHAAAPLLRAGFITVTVDLLGTGASTCPSDGRAATVSLQTSALAEAIESWSALRRVASVDLLGESWGGAIASQLAADAERIRSCVIVSAAFRTPTPTLNAAARAPGTRAGLDRIPDGYIPVGLEIWGPLLAPSPPEVRAWATARQLGRIPSAPMYAVLELPYFDPSVARAPGLILRGAEDPLVSEADSRDLAETYGHPDAQLVNLEGATHIPRIEEASRTKFWATVLDFLR